MYKNVGKKITILAQVLGWVSLGAGLFAWLYFIGNSAYWGPIKSDDWIGWACLISGVVSFITSWILYGFGQLVSHVSDIRDAQIALYQASKQDNSTNQIEADELPES